MTLGQEQEHTEETLKTVESLAQEKELWDRQDEAVAEILRNPETFFGKYGDSLFAPREEHEITCMDERVEVSEPGLGRIAIAGSTVLQSIEQMLATIAKIGKHKINVVAIRRHTGCAAESLAQQNGTEAEPRVLELAQRLKSSYAGFSPMFNVQRHVARGMVLSGTLHFNDDVFRSEYTPLVISERFTPTAYVEAGIGVLIAFGKHNHLNNFSRENPFPITVIGDPSSKWHRREQMLASLRSGLFGNTETAKLMPHVLLNGIDGPRLN
jgi:hypothetical protein